MFGLTAEPTPSQPTGPNHIHTAFPLSDTLGMLLADVGAVAGQRNRGTRSDFRGDDGSPLSLERAQISPRSPDAPTHENDR